MTIAEIHQIFLSSAGVCTDTRNLQQNQIFFALSGPNFNGNRFAEVAIDKGALLVIVDDDHYVLNKQCIYVQNALSTLQQLAHFHRSYWGKKIIAITGSNGKTTCKELSTAVLSKKYHVLSTKGNLNNHIGVPLTLLNLNREHDLAIVEMGANHAKEIHDLCTIVNPEYGVITNIGLAHIEGFGSKEGIAKAKRELFDCLQENNGTCFVNQKDPFLNTQLPKNSVFFNATYALQDGLFCTIKKNDTLISSQLVGQINAANIDLAYTLGQFFDVDQASIVSAIAEYVPSNNRSEKRETSRNTLILDAYNANPSSVMAALDDFSKITGSKKWAVLGSMAELGSYTEIAHKEVVEHCKKHAFNAIFIGDGFKTLHQDYTWFASANNHTLQQWCNDVSGAVILIKGSRKEALEQLVQYL